MILGAGMRIGLFVTGLRIEGAGTCPAPAEVTAQVTRWLPSQASGDDSQVVRITEHGDDLVVSHEGSDGNVLATRRFARTFSCRELGSAVAVAIAAWQSDVHPEFAPNLAARTPPPPPAVSPLPAPSPSAVTIGASADATATEPWDLTAGVSVGFGTSVDVPVTGADATVGLWVRPPARATSLRFEIEGQSKRQMALAGGQAAWRHVTAGIGVERPWLSSAPSPPSALFRWFALARLGWLGLRGEGFDLDHSDDVVDAGATLGLRAVVGRGRWSSWAELAVSVWPIRHELLGPASAGGTERLPVVETFVRIGAGADGRP